MRYVIIGNGVAGIHAAESIRRCDIHGKITLISDETFPPYCRPMISMVLEGSADSSQLPIRRDNFYLQNKITPKLGRRVSTIDTENRRVLLPDTGNCETAIAFDRLLIATGADPRPVKADGLDLSNIFYMRTEAHVRAMGKIAGSAKTALVLGGGLVGFKAAYGLMRRGIRVTLLIRSGHPLSMQVDETAGELIRRELVQKGLTVRTGVEVRAFKGEGCVRSALLSDGSEIPCDMAVIGKGVLPALSFVPKEKIAVDLGILVDEHMETGVPGIYAAGDAAEFIDIARQKRWVNAIWPEAADQGRIAGLNMAGRPTAYPGSLSRNVIRVFDTDVMTAGIVNPSNTEGYEILSEQDERRKTYRRLVFREDILCGMVLVNRIEQGGLLTALIRSRTPVRISKKRLLGPALNYKCLISTF